MCYNVIQAEHLFELGLEMMQMQQFRIFFIVLLIAFIFMFLLGCSNQAGEQGIQESEIVEEAVSTIIPEENTTVNVPPGKADRLPGSLRWNSVELYAQGVDFFKDQPNGLAAAETTANDQEETATTEPSEPAQAADTASQTTDNGQTSAGETSAGQDSSLPQDGDVFITTVDDTADWGSVLTLDDEEEDDGQKWYELD